MIELDIPTLTAVVSQCFANSRNNQAFNSEQRLKWLIKGLEMRQLLLQLIGKEMTEGVNSEVGEANQRLGEINQRLKDLQETLKNFNQTLIDLTILADILGQIVDVVSLVFPAHATVKSPAPTPSPELLALAAAPPDILVPTAANSGSDPNETFNSADKLLVKGKGNLGELIAMPVRSGNIVPPYASSSRPLAVNSPLPLESVIGRDDRKRILDTQNAPWRMICSLSIRGPSNNFVGTGWFAGPKTIITAAHCLYEESQMKGWARQIEIFPGRDGNNFPYEAVISQNFEVPQEWLESRGTNPDYDYGVIHLDTPLGERTGWFSVAVARDEELNGTFVNLSGYPGDAAGGFGIYQLFHADIISSVVESRFFYTIDTYGGQSGAPVWQELNNGSRQVVGIHTYGVGGSFQQNSATRITPTILGDVKKWLKSR